MAPSTDVCGTPEATGRDMEQVPLVLTLNNNCGNTLWTIMVGAFVEFMKGAFMPDFIEGLLTFNKTTPVDCFLLSESGNMDATLSSWESG